jgi:hypothetical protein
MATIISCPNCARRLSLKQALPADTLLKCSACQAEFTLPADLMAARRTELDDRRHGTENQGAFSEGLTVPAGRNQADAADHDDPRPRWSSFPDDDENEWSGPLEKRRHWRNFALSGGVLAGALLIVWALLRLAGGDTELVGSWKGTFRFAGLEIDCTYQFRADGTFVDEHVEPGIGILVRASGRYTYSNGRVRIHWDNGGFENASVRKTDANTIDYVIESHSDRAQIGGKATFRRVAQ